MDDLGDIGTEAIRNRKASEDAEQERGQGEKDQDDKDIGSLRVKLVDD